MTDARCHHCGDPSPRGFRYCLHCHSWNDLACALQYARIGVDEYRLRRALRYIRRGDRRDSVRSLLAKLTRRVAELEYELL